jgi:hypothetical protein
MSDLLLAMGVLLLVGGAVLAWPPPANAATDAPPTPSGRLMAALRDYVDRRR